MAHKEPRVECKIYLRPEERDHLKQVALEKEVSLSDLIRTTMLKKYPMSKQRKARSVDLTSPIAKDIPPVLLEQEPLENHVPEKRESTVDGVVSCDVESMTRDEQEARLKFLKHKIHMAYNGESLDKEIFNAYIDETYKFTAAITDTAFDGNDDVIVSIKLDLDNPMTYKDFVGDTNYISELILTYSMKNNVFETRSFSSNLLTLLQQQKESN